MPTKLLAAAGLAAILAVVGLGVWGWTGRDEARARHQVAVRARDQERFCAALGQPLGFLTGRVLDPDVPINLPAVPPSDLDLANSAPMLSYLFTTNLTGDVPPVIEDEVTVMRDVAAEVQTTSSPEPFRRSEVRRAIATLTRYWEDNCA